MCRGFEWQGTTYHSLSAIARAITGTAWEVASNPYRTMGSLSAGLSMDDYRLACEKSPIPKCSVIQ
jgi:hypothetical protein